MNYQYPNFSGEGSWNVNVKEDLKVEFFLKIYMIFLSFVNLNVVQKSKKAKLYL